RARRARALARRRLRRVPGRHPGDNSGGGMTARCAVTAFAGTNIALVKYWGKRDAALNLPATGSLSLTLDRLGTRTTVQFDGHRDAGPTDRIAMTGGPADTA